MLDRLVLPGGHPRREVSAGDRALLLAQLLAKRFALVLVVLSPLPADVAPGLRHPGRNRWLRPLAGVRRRNQPGWRRKRRGRLRRCGWLRPCGRNRPRHEIATG